MNVNQYQQYFTAKNLMGPNSVRLINELFSKQPLELARNGLILDLGCGTGLTSFVIAKETGAKVYANDLWISAEDNAKRFAEWGVVDQVTPVREDANHLNFEEKTFDTLISVDSYHYFAGKEGFFEQKLLPFIKDKGTVLIAIPGLKMEFEGRAEELLKDWLGDEAYMFHSAGFWKRMMGSSERIDTVETWEMTCFDKAWSDWLSTENKHAVNDKRYFETIIKPYTCFVGIAVKVK